MADDNERWQTPRKLAKQIHDLAAELRHNSTRSEEMLWEQLRNRKLEGRKFRRQVPIGTYVVDFYCAEEKLVIEVNGSVHDGQQEADKLRQEAIEMLGINFIRASATEVEANIKAVLQKIIAGFSKHTSENDS